MPIEQRDDREFREGLELLGLSFYRDILGLKPLAIVPRVWAHFEAPGGGEIALQLQRPKRNEPAPVSVEVSDVRSFVDELRARGVKSKPVSKILRLSF